MCGQEASGPAGWAGWTGTRFALTLGAGCLIRHILSETYPFLQEGLAWHRLKKSRVGFLTELLDYETHFFSFFRLLHVSLGSAEGVNCMAWCLLADSLYSEWWCPCPWHRVPGEGRTHSGAWLTGRPYATQLCSVVGRKRKVFSSLSWLELL